MICSFDQVLLNAQWILQCMKLTEEAAWNQTAADWEVFFKHGTVLGCVLQSDLVATAAVLPYCATFGWISLVLVTPQWRRQGLATRLVRACVTRLREIGRAALLDAAPAGVPLYTQLGFIPLGSMGRWQGIGGSSGDGWTTVDLARDAEAFGANRKFLLENFLLRPGSASFRSSHGWAILRSGRVATHLGPMIADPEEAPGLLREAVRVARGQVVIDVLEAGQERLVPELVSLGFSQTRSFTRMGLGISALPGNPRRLLAAAGPEFG